jgi:hypothetical protein
MYLEVEYSVNRSTFVMKAVSGQRLSDMKLEGLFKAGICFVSPCG